MINKKMLLGMLVLGVIASVAAAGTWAEFTSSATSKENTFTAGTLKISLSSAFVFNGIVPGQTLAPKTITVKNDGTIDVSNVNVVLVPKDTDAVPGYHLSSQIIVDSLTLGGNDLLASSGLTAGSITMASLNGKTLSTSSPTPIASIGSKDLVLNCHIADMDDNYQNAQCKVDITFNAVQ